MMMTTAPPTRKAPPAIPIGSFLWAAPVGQVTSSRVLSDVVCMRFSTSGFYLAVGYSEGSIEIWSTQSWDNVHRIRTIIVSIDGPVQSLAWDPKLECVLYIGGPNGVLHKHSVERYKTTGMSDDTYSVPATAAFIHDMAMDEGGNRLIIASGEDIGLVQNPSSIGGEWADLDWLYLSQEATSGTRARSVLHEPNPCDVAVKGDLVYVAHIGSLGIRVFSLSKRSLVRKIPQVVMFGTGEVYAGGKFSPNARYAAMCRANDAIIDWYCLESGSLVRVTGLGLTSSLNIWNATMQLLFLDEETVLTGSNDNGFIIWTMRLSSPVCSPNPCQGYIRFMDIHYDAKTRTRRIAYASRPPRGYGGDFEFQIHFLELLVRPPGDEQAEGMGWILKPEHTVPKFAAQTRDRAIVKNDSVTEGGRAVVNTVQKDGHEKLRRFLDESSSTTTDHITSPHQSPTTQVSHSALLPADAATIQGEALYVPPSQTVPARPTEPLHDSPSPVTHGTPIAPWGDGKLVDYLDRSYSALVGQNIPSEAGRATVAKPIDMKTTVKPPTPALSRSLTSIILTPHPKARHAHQASPFSPPRSPPPAVTASNHASSPFSPPRSPAPVPQPETSPSQQEVVEGSGAVSANPPSTEAWLAPLRTATMKERSLIDADIGSEHSEDAVFAGCTFVTSSPPRTDTWLESSILIPRSPVMVPPDHIDPPWSIVFGMTANDSQVPSAPRTDGRRSPEVSSPLAQTPQIAPVAEPPDFASAKDGIRGEHSLSTTANSLMPFVSAVSSPVGVKIPLPPPPPPESPIHTPITLQPSPPPQSPYAPIGVYIPLLPSPPPHSPIHTPIALEQVKPVGVQLDGEGWSESGNDQSVDGGRCPDALTGTETSLHGVLSEEAPAFASASVSFSTFPQLPPVSLPPYTPIGVYIPLPPSPPPHSPIHTPPVSLLPHIPLWDPSLHAVSPPLVKNPWDITSTQDHTLESPGPARLMTSTLSSIEPADDIFRFLPAANHESSSTDERTTPTDENVSSPSPQGQCNLDQDAESGDVGSISPHSSTIQEGPIDSSNEFSTNEDGDDTRSTHLSTCESPEYQLPSTTTGHEAYLIVGAAVLFIALLVVILYWAARSSSALPDMKTDGTQDQLPSGDAEGGHVPRMVLENGASVVKTMCMNSSISETTIIRRETYSTATTVFT